MRKIVLESYKIKARNQDSDELEEVEFDVKEALITILFLPALQLQAKELLERDKLANKINDTKNGFVLLEDAEYEKVETAVNTHTGFTKHHVEFVRRVLEAEKVAVTEEKPKSKAGK